MFDRRTMISGSLAVGAASGIGVARAAAKPPPQIQPILDALAALEKGQARLGVCILDTGNAEMIGNRMDEHFAMCSTFKLALAAACFAEAEADRMDLQRKITFSRDDLVVYSPVTQDHVGDVGMRIVDLMETTVKTSDNTAANLLIDSLGGPGRVTSIFRRMGDDVTRLDRNEPMMNLVLSADLRDTTSPRAMAGLIAEITTGSLLSDPARQTIIQWMIDTRTGLNRIRAGLPPDWVAGDKTGTGRGSGMTNKYNDVAIAFPPDRSPLIISAHYDSGRQSEQLEADQQAVLAKVGTLAAEWSHVRSSVA